MPKHYTAKYILTLMDPKSSFPITSADEYRRTRSNTQPIANILDAINQFKITITIPHTKLRVYATELEDEIKQFVRKQSAAQLGPDNLNNWTDLKSDLDKLILMAECICRKAKIYIEDPAWSHHFRRALINKDSFILTFTSARSALLNNLKHNKTLFAQIVASKIHQALHGFIYIDCSQLSQEEISKIFMQIGQAADCISYTETGNPFISPMKKQLSQFDRLFYDPENQFTKDLATMAEFMQEMFQRNFPQYWKDILTEQKICAIQDLARRAAEPFIQAKIQDANRKKIKRIDGYLANRLSDRSKQTPDSPLRQQLDLHETVERMYKKGLVKLTPDSDDSADSSQSDDTVPRVLFLDEKENKPPTAAAPPSTGKQTAPYHANDESAKKRLRDIRGDADSSDDSPDSPSPVPRKLFPAPTPGTPEGASLTNPAGVVAATFSGTPLRSICNSGENPKTPDAFFEQNIKLSQMR